MTVRRILLILSCVFSCLAVQAAAQSLTLTTVTREPFSLARDGVDTGFSIDLWNEIADALNYETEIVRVGQFGEMFEMLDAGTADIAAANISITAAREASYDFTQPIFAAGLQIMVRPTGTGISVWSVILNPQLLLAVVGAFAALMACGMLMWVFERRDQEYFKGTARESAFPAFWWALNLVVNGGFEERMPRSPMGRVFGVLLVVSSLFIVSIFVATITANMTVGAIKSNVSGLNDLYDKRVGTISGSTAADTLETRDLRYVDFNSLDTMLDAFEIGYLDAIVFDAPILAYYANTRGRGKAELVGSVFLPENYGFVMQSGSPLAEDINRALLRLVEDGTYDNIRRKWFGN
ncbi:transporter substrate-binding domain-containing protein [Thalassobium sp. R2A62]|uniref:transporter substrate-binding domain-containing protein n=1 Tax=Thalassobium sp. R2A62 TaxID=633131 RepID=UPI0001B1D831|nr:transporter substrate-binding domain-containing protein [Thalassobium sp. R2A62]EET48799.1 glutamine ABC transporter, periplasmic glutamine-binding protein [Thalassobium sp. R2A62]MDG1340708.1 transporter substrate-binding domain-containing protein [Paracoccaceae bacterium]MDG2451727.1 transporter substrate-binding domain-containing protein [Paracoccaceae bacterium]